MPLLVGVLMLCYFTLPESVAVHHTESGNPDGFVDKQDLFYMSFGIIIVFNLLWGVLKTQVLKINFAKLNPMSVWAKSPEQLSGLIEGWFNAFLALTNTFLAFVLLGVRRINSTENQKLDFDYNWVLVVGFVLLIILIFILPIRLLFTNPSEEQA